MSLKKRSPVILLAILLSLAMSSCSNDDDVPPEENEEEIITNASLVFAPTGGGSAVTATAVDPDGEGPQPLAILSNIILEAGTTYTMTIDLQNALEGESISEEIAEEGDEHMFFFAWTNDVFSDPTGNGNIDNRADAVNYNDQDEDGNPLGLSTTWTAASAGQSGTFRVVLKHQPDLKSTTSDSSVGSTDLDLTFSLNIQ